MGRHDLATLANNRDLAGESPALSVDSIMTLGFPMSVESQAETAAEF